MGGLALSPSATALSPLLRATTTNEMASFRVPCHWDLTTGNGRCRRADLIGRAPPFLPHFAATSCNPSPPIPRFRSPGAHHQPTDTMFLGIKDKVFMIEAQVHNDDLDTYGVVNNAVYAIYINHARDALLEYYGMGAEYWASTGNAMASLELNLKYFAPLRSGDRFMVKVWPEKIKGVRMVVRHLIETVPEGKLVLDARATIVFLNKDYRPTRVFPEMAAKLWEIFGCMEG